MATAISAPSFPLTFGREHAPARRARIGSWIVESELGRGGMASVHAVAHQKLGQRAAIKIAHRTIFNERFTPTTFLREARVVRKVEHPGVTQVFSTGTTEGRPYIVMERLVGTPLGRRIDAGPLPRREAVEVLLELCDILRAAHAAGVVHRDLKLDNVLLLDRPLDGGKRVKLVDWGVAHVEGEDDPFRGLIAGTLVYVAPELVRGAPVTPAADIYSLAVLAYHLLCHRPPFASTSDLSLISMHLRAEPPRASAAWADIPPALDELLLAMLSKQPGERPSLDTIERELRATLLALAVAPARPSLSAFLAKRNPPDDPFGRPSLPSPPFRPGWIGLAVTIVALTGLLSALA